MMSESKPTKKTSSSSSSSEKDGASPYGFVLKLYQMVNGAPDEIISWVSAGDAFHIKNLKRLENETLPSFFRHGRFQSLVRQLNFYNFRKINRERTFWVYRHPLFHRDRPQDLHLLRRRTCQGGDGRKKSISSNNVDKSEERNNVLVDHSSTSWNGATAKPEDDVSNGLIRLYDSQVHHSAPNAVVSPEKLHDYSGNQFLVSKQQTSLLIMPEIDLTKQQSSNELVPPPIKTDLPSSSELDSHPKKRKRLIQLQQYNFSSSSMPSSPVLSSNSFTRNTSTSSTEENYDSHTRSLIVTPDSSEDEEILSSASDCIALVKSSVRFFVPPVCDQGLMTSIKSKLMPVGLIPATIIHFCLATPPLDLNLEVKILHLLRACSPLAEEFSRYRSALFPHSSPPDSTTATADVSFSRLATSMQAFTPSHYNNGKGYGCKKSINRDFTVFALNWMDILLSQHISAPLPNNNIVHETTNDKVCYDLERHETMAVQKCAKLWYESTRTNV